MRGNKNNFVYKQCFIKIKGTVCGSGETIFFQRNRGRYRFSKEGVFLVFGRFPGENLNNVIQG